MTFRSALALLALGHLLGSSACGYVSGPVISAEDPQPDAGDLTVLFIGNSLTYAYDMPGLFEKVAEANGKAVYVRTSALANATIEDLASDGGTLDLIASREWDVVALQDSRYRVAFPDKVWELVPFYEEIEVRIRASSPDARILINMWFPMQDGATLYGSYYDFETLQRAIWEGTVALADSLDYTVAPVGAAWLKVMAERPDIVLFASDRSHPTYAGQYLQACIHYGSIYGTGPSGSDPAEPTANGPYLRQAAGEVILSDPDDWNLPPLTRTYGGGDR